ncbi:MAG: LCP family protein [Clostridiales bacterium]|nr:LCP family protein [Candidatus Scatonaster coprocaballi]
MLLVITDRIKKKATSSPSSSDGSAYLDPYETEEVDPVIYYDGKPYVAKKNIETILCMGIDSNGEAQEREGNRNDDQVDVLLLLVLNHEEKTYRVLEINRDTMTDIPKIGTTGDRLGTTVAQIALSHTYGSGLQDSCEYTCEALSNLLMGEKIQHYITLKLDSIAIMNHSVGGVEVEIPYDMTVVDPTMTKGAKLNLNDEQAETFIRARTSLDDEHSNNVTRMERQNMYLENWKKKAKEKINADASFALELIAELGDYMISDMDLNTLSKLSEYLTEYESCGRMKIQGESKHGEEFMEFYCDGQSLKETVLDLFYEEKTM